MDQHFTCVSPFNVVITQKRCTVGSPVPLTAACQEFGQEERAQKVDLPCLSSTSEQPQTSKKRKHLHTFLGEKLGAEMSMRKVFFFIMAGVKDLRLVMAKENGSIHSQFLSV